MTGWNMDHHEWVDVFPIIEKGDFGPVSHLSEFRDGEWWFPFDDFKSLDGKLLFN